MHGNSFKNYDTKTLEKLNEMIKKIKEEDILTEEEYGFFDSYYLKCKTITEITKEKKKNSVYVSNLKKVVISKLKDIFFSMDS